MAGDDRRRSCGDPLRLFLFLACLGSQAVSGEWLSFRGCWNLTSSGNMKINLTNIGPSACLNACPENTTVLALQGRVCECRSTVVSRRHDSQTNCMLCSGGTDVECKVTHNSSWYMYEKVDQSALSGYTLESQNGTKCLAVNNTTPLKYQVLDCDTNLPALCHDFIQSQCIQTYGNTAAWNGIGKICSSTSGLRTSPVGPGEIGSCKQSGPLNGGTATNGHRYWTGLTFIPRNIPGIFSTTTSPQFPSSLAEQSSALPEENSSSINYSSDIQATQTSLIEPSSASAVANSISIDYSTDNQATTVSRMPYFTDESLTSTFATVSQTAAHEQLSSVINSSKVSAPLSSIQTSRGVYYLISSVEQTIMSTSIFISSISVVETVIQTSIVATRTSSNSLASSMISVTPYTNSDITITAHSTTYSEVIPSRTSSKLYPTSGSSTIVATSIATTTSSTGTDKQTAIVIEASIGVVAALLLVVIGVGAFCMVRITRGIKRVEETNNAMSEIVSHRFLGSRTSSVFTDSGTVADFFGQEMPEPDFTSLNRFPESAQPSLLHNGLTSTGRESGVCHL